MPTALQTRKRQQHYCYFPCLYLLEGYKVLPFLWHGSEVPPYLLHGCEVDGVRQLEECIHVQHLLPSQLSLLQAGKDLQEPPYLRNGSEVLPYLWHGSSVPPYLLHGFKVDGVRQLEEFVHVQHLLPSQLTLFQAGGDLHEPPYLRNGSQVTALPVAWFFSATLPVAWL